MEILINGKAHTVAPGEISYDVIVRLAGMNPELRPTVTMSNKWINNALAYGERAYVMPGKNAPREGHAIMFEVAHTSEA